MPLQRRSGWPSGLRLGALPDLGLRSFTLGSNSRYGRHCRATGNTFNTNSYLKKNIIILILNIDWCVVQLEQRIRLRRGPEKVGAVWRFLFWLTDCPFI